MNDDETVKLMLTIIRLMNTKHSSWASFTVASSAALPITALGSTSGIFRLLFPLSALVRKPER